MNAFLDKVLFFLACLIPPGLWGLFVGWICLKYIPARWCREPSAPGEKQASHWELDPDVWDYQI